MREIIVKFGESGRFLHWPWPVTDDHRRRMAANHDRIVQALGWTHSGR